MNDTEARLAAIRERAGNPHPIASAWLGTYYRHDVTWLLAEIDRLRAKEAGNA